MNQFVKNRFVVQLITINAEIKTYEVLELFLNPLKSPGEGTPTTLLYCRTLQMLWSFFLLCFTHTFTSQRSNNSSVDFLLLYLLQYSYRAFEYIEYEANESEENCVTPLLKVALTLFIAKETKLISWIVSSKCDESKNCGESKYSKCDSDDIISPRYSPSPDVSVHENESDEHYENFDDQSSHCILNETEINEFYGGIPFIADGESNYSPENIPYDKMLEIDPYQLKYPKGNPAFTEGYYGIMKPGSLCYPRPRPSKEIATKMPKTDLSKRDFKRFLIEFKTMMLVGHHDNVVEMVGAWTRDLSHGKLLIIVEYCELGSMYEYLQSNMLRLEGKNSILTGVHRWLYEISSGMYFLHSHNIIHGSLCTRRILLTKNHTVKLTEFGIAPHLFSASRKPFEETANEVLWPWRNLSYETLTENVSKKRSDSWSFAITSWEILTLGSIPYAEHSHFHTGFCEALKSGMQVKFPATTCDLLRDLFSSCLTVSPKNRPTSKKILGVMYQLTKPKRRKLSFRVHPEVGVSGE